MPGSAPHTLLVVDPESAAAGLLQNTLHAEGVRVQQRTDSRALLHSLQAEEVDAKSLVTSAAP